jgi:hypothetical protein
MNLRSVAAYLIAWTALALLFSSEYALEMWSENRELAIVPGLRGAALFFSAWAALAWMPYRLGLRYPVQRPVATRHVMLLAAAAVSCAAMQIPIRFTLADLMDWERGRSLSELTAAHLSLNIVIGATIVSASQAVAWRRRVHAHEQRQRELELASAC